MISLKNTAVHLMTKIVCLMTVQNVHLENYANYLIPTLIQNLIWILILIPIQAARYLSTVGKHPLSMLPKYASLSHLRELPRGSKNLRHIYSKRSQNCHYNNVKESLDHGQILVHLDLLSHTKTQDRTRFKVHILRIAHSALFQPAVTQNKWMMQT